MTATTPRRDPPTDRYSWVDAINEEGGWGFPETVISRAQLLEEVHARGMPLSERQLREWERIGMLPTAIRRKHGKRPQAVYPDWWPSLVADAARSIQSGGSREQVKRNVRVWLALGRGAQVVANAEMVEIHAAAERIAAAYRQAGMPGYREIAAARFMFVDARGEPVFVRDVPLIPDN